MSDNITVDVFEDTNTKVVVCWRNSTSYMRLRMTEWQAWRFSVQIKIRKLLRLPLLPYKVPAGVEVESGPVPSD